MDLATKCISKMKIKIKIEMEGCYHQRCIAGIVADIETSTKTTGDIDLELKSDQELIAAVKHICCK